MLDRFLASSLLILAVVAIRPLLRHHPVTRYALWLPVLLVLLLPFHPVESGLSLRNLTDRIPLIHHAQLLEDVSHIELHPDGTVSGLERYVIMPDYSIYVTEGVSDGEFRAMKGWLTLRPYLDLIRRSGMLLLALAFMGMNIAFRENLGKHRRPLEGDHPIPVWIAEGLTSPCLFGLFSPSVYLTEEAARDPAIRSFALQHEFTHWRHRDHIWSFFRTAVLVLYWYHPFVWLAVILSRRDGELACDAKVCRDLDGAGRADYGRALIALTVQTVDRSLFVNGTAMLGSKKALFTRVERIAHGKRGHKAVLLIALLLMAFSLVLTCTAAASAPSEFHEWRETFAAEDIRYAQASYGYGLSQVAYVLTREDVREFAERFRAVPKSEVTLSAGHMLTDHTLILVDQAEHEILFQSDGVHVWITFDESFGRRMERAEGFWQIENADFARYIISLSEEYGTPVVQMQ